MRISRLAAIFSSAALILALQLTSATPAHADTYSIIANWAENTWGFHGIDPTGNVYLENFYSGQYVETEILSANGSSTITYSDLPLTFTQDRGSICKESVPGFTRILNGLCNGNLFAFLYATDEGPDTSLYKYSGTGTAQLVTSADDGDLLGLNSLGDIVFDNGFIDEAYYAIDLTTLPTTTPAPEPSTLLLLATGLLAPILLLRRRLS